jgi:hypothetical protein
MDPLCQLPLPLPLIKTALPAGPSLRTGATTATGQPHPAANILVRRDQLDYPY